MIKGIDFYCGAGGLTRGLLNVGIQVLAGIDIDKRLKDTYEKNNEPSRFIGADARNIDIITLRHELGITDEDKVVYAACTPCQPFSTLNRMKGSDPRKELLIAFAEIVKAAPPDFIVVENVPGLNTAYGRDVYERFLTIITDCGFHDPYAEFLDAQDFGVPQVRKRFILLASRHGAVVPPCRAKERVTVAQAIRKYPALDDGGSSTEYKNHQSRLLMPHHRVIVQAIPPDGGSRRDVADTSILLKCHQEKPTVHKDVFGRMAWQAPAPTLTGRCTDVYCGRFVHPVQHRGISLRRRPHCRRSVTTTSFMERSFTSPG